MPHSANTPWFRSLSFRIAGVLSLALVPIGSIATTTDFEAYGVTPNTVLGTLSPSVSAIDGRFALEGAFGIVAPDM